MSVFVTVGPFSFASAQIRSVWQSLLSTCTPRKSALDRQANTEMLSRPNFCSDRQPEMASETNRMCLLGRPLLATHCTIHGPSGGQRWGKTNGRGCRAPIDESASRSRDGFAALARNGWCDRQQIVRTDQEPRHTHTLTDACYQLSTIVRLPNCDVQLNRLISVRSDGFLLIAEKKYKQNGWEIVIGTRWPWTELSIRYSIASRHDRYKNKWIVLFESHSD